MRGESNKNRKMVTQLILGLWWKTVFSHDYPCLNDCSISAGIGIIKERRELFLLESLAGRKGFKG